VKIEEQPFSPLVADVIGAMIGQSHDASTRLIDSLTSQLADTHATIDAIRTSVSELLDGPYVPSAHAIERALYPSNALRDQFRVDTIE
jgi:hypothetical protein